MSADKEEEFFTDTSSRSETDERVYAVYRWRLSGIIARRDILQLASKQGWEMSDRAIDEYIKRAKLMIKEIGRSDAENEFDQAYCRLNDLYVQSYKNQDWRLCQSIQRDISELYGLYQMRVNISGDINATIEMKHKEFERIQNELGVIKRKQCLEADLLSTLAGCESSQDAQCKEPKI